MFGTVLQVEFVELAEFRLRKLHLHARFADSNDHNVRMLIGRGVGGTATREIPAPWVPKGDSQQRDAPFVVRSGFRVEPLSAPADLTMCVGLPSTRTLGPLRFGRNELILNAGAGLRLLAASEDEFAPIFDGVLTLEV
jgi:hypothetical protein